MHDDHDVKQRARPSCTALTIVELFELIDTDRDQGDPQLEPLLRTRKIELGSKAPNGASLSNELQQGSVARAPADLGYRIATSSVSPPPNSICTLPSRPPVMNRA